MNARAPTSEIDGFRNDLRKKRMDVNGKSCLAVTLEERRIAVNELLLHAIDSHNTKINMYTGATDVFPIDNEAMEHMRQLTQSACLKVIIRGAERNSPRDTFLRSLPNTELKTVPLKKENDFGDFHIMHSGDASLLTIQDYPFVANKEMDLSNVGVWVNFNYPSALSPLVANLALSKDDKTFLNFQGE